MADKGALNKRRNGDWSTKQGVGKATGSEELVVFTDRQARWSRDFSLPILIYNSILTQVTKPAPRLLNMQLSASGESELLSVSKVVEAL